MQKQLAKAADLDVGAGLCEKVPEQHLIRGEDRSIDRSLKRRDCFRRPEPVPPDEHRLGPVVHMPRRPLVDRGGLNSARIQRESGRLCRDDVEAGVSEVGSAKLVQLSIEPRRVDERDAPDLEDAQCEHRRRARRDDRNADSPRHPRDEGRLGGESDRIRSCRRCVGDDVERAPAEQVGQLIEYVRGGQRTQPEGGCRFAPGPGATPSADTRATQVTTRPGAITGNSASGPTAACGVSTPTRITRPDMPS